MNDFITITKIKEIEKHLRDPKETLVIFDIDYVLTHPNEAAFQFPNFAYHMAFIRETFLNLTPLQRDIFANLMVFDACGTSLVEKEAPKFIQHLQKKGFKTLALTATLTSQLQELALKEERYNNLKQLGIDFNSSFSDLDELTFDMLEPNRKTYPSFYKGILFSNGENQINQKGPALKAFLEHLNMHPKSILMVDDRAPNLEGIINSFIEEPIEVKGFLYKGSFIFPSERVEKDAFEKKWQEIAKKAMELSGESNEVSSQ